jgi:hypothetical protein
MLTKVNINVLKITPIDANRRLRYVSFFTYRLYLYIHSHPVLGRLALLLNRLNGHISTAYMPAFLTPSGGVCDGP